MIDEAARVARSCPACEAADSEVFLSRHSVPVHQNSLFATPDSARSMIRGELEMTVCRSCGFVFNAAFDDALVSYDETYDNNQVFSVVFNRYVDELVAYLLDDCGLRGKTIVEVGCGKGYFIEKLVAGEERNRGLGFDPTYLGPLEKQAGRLTFERSFYGPDSVHVVADAVVCRHVIEHVADPAAMLRSIRSALLGSPNARVYFETPAVEWILENTVVWDFFYEHCSLFSETSITALFERCGFEVVAVRRVFDGQYLWTEARLADSEVTTDRSTAVAAIAGLAAEYGRKERELVATLRGRIRELRRNGVVAIWGAGAKGVTFAHLIDEDRQLIDCVVDLNPRKQGHYVPGTGHLIVNYTALAERGVTDAIVMNPNYRDENQALLTAGGIDVRLHLEES